MNLTDAARQLTKLEDEIVDVKIFEEDDHQVTLLHIRGKLSYQTNHERWEVLTPANDSVIFDAGKVTSIYPKSQQLLTHIPLIILEWR